MNSVANIFRYIKSGCFTKWLVLINEIADFLLGVCGFIGCCIIVMSSESFKEAVMDAVAILFVLDLDQEYLTSVMELVRVRVWCICVFGMHMCA